MNKRPDLSGNLVFVPVIVFEVSGDGEYIFHNQGNNTLWVLDDLKIQSSLISDEIILISMISCCFGFPLGIIALIGWFVVWRKKDKKLQKIIVKEEIMTTDQLFKQYNSAAENDRVPAPFLDIEKGEETVNELSLKVKDFVEEHVGSEENEYMRNNDGNWENWDDGE